MRAGRGGGASACARRGLDLLLTADAICPGRDPSAPEDILKYGFVLGARGARAGPEASVPRDKAELWAGFDREGSHGKSATVA